MRLSVLVTHSQNCSHTLPLSRRCTRVVISNDSWNPKRWCLHSYRIKPRKEGTRLMTKMLIVEKSALHILVLSVLLLHCNTNRVGSKLHLVGIIGGSAGCCKIFLQNVLIRRTHLARARDWVWSVPSRYDVNKLDESKHCAQDEGIIPVTLRH